VEVDGEVFSVKVSPIWDGHGGALAPETAQALPASRELTEGAIVCGMAGLVLSIHVKVGDSVAEGDEVATLETMKMRRHIVSSRQGAVREIRAQEGQMVDAEDVLMVVA
jgi:pyruvate carboxylase subunit B